LLLEPFVPISRDPPFPVQEIFIRLGVQLFKADSLLSGSFQRSIHQGEWRGADPTLFFRTSFVIDFKTEEKLGKQALNVYIYDINYTKSVASRSP
jgi:hypothetical protein